ncbi:hypothetical protein AXF42_Ash021575 [Apostasia shenzhenica]|uniref:Tf2-1-like SH3-like domain-containing protein n=1 Tax=Apostasia shenzhenica TaxID=1088818 RepID=A0A2H9ZYI2_9ASPA|nr:hypothetical protein AXF42_Ash021575 [Apostasia shenzhenica]
MAKIGAVAYKLRLPEYAKIHLVFYVSILKKKLGHLLVEENLPTEITSVRQLKAEPIAILRRRTILRKRRLLQQALIQWNGSHLEEATWEDIDFLHSEYLSFFS